MVAADGNEALQRVGRFVKARRRERGYDSQQELADAAGVTLSTAALLERGRTFPRARNIARFETALGVAPGTLRAVRDNQPLPGASPTAQHSPVALSPTAPRSVPAASSQADAMAIATVAADLGGRAAAILLRYAATDAEARAGVATLEDHLFRLESLIAALVPHADDIDETLSAMRAVHAQRLALRDLVAASPQGSSPPAG